MTAVRRLAQLGGTVYTAIALLGFAVTGLSDPFVTTGVYLGMELNPAHNLLHLLVGAALLAAAASNEATARSLVLLTAACLGTLGMLAPTMIGTEANVLALDTPDAVLHLGTAVVAGLCLALTTASDRTHRDVRS